MNNLENIIDLINEMADEESTVFAISHNSELQNVFDNVMIVQNRKGVSTIVN